MKITMGFDAFKNFPLTVGEEFIKAGWNFTQHSQEEYFEIFINENIDLLEFYKILVNN